MKKGIALIVAVFVVITFSIVGVIAVSILSSQGFGVLKDFKGSQAFNVAEAGMNYTLVMLKGDNSFLLRQH